MEIEQEEENKPSEKVTVGKRQSNEIGNMPL